jgi:hypothetical protein
MADQAVEEPVVTEPAPAAAPQAPDPFALDEAKLISLTPEQRAALDPVISEWKSKATEEIEKTRKTSEEKYKPLEEKASALDNLVKDQRFVQWWNTMQQTATQGLNGQQQRMAGQVQPSDIARPEEWTQALQNAYAGDPAQLQELQARMMAAWATPVVKDINRKQEMLETTLEMKDVFERHPDAKDLDKIGLDASDKNSMSLLEAAMYLVHDQRGGSLEQAYRQAKAWESAMKTSATQQAMGMVQDKKAGVTAGPSTSQGGAPVVYVENADELIRKNMDFLMANPGQKAPQFVIKPSGK